MDRRRFLQSATGVVALAPGLTLMAPAGAEETSGASSEQRWGLLIDANRCSADCDACIRACRTENNWDDTGTGPQDPQWLRKVTVTDPDSGYRQDLPMMCQHCAQPPCADVCPTGASFKRADGIVLVDKHRCIGCRYCMMACPYKARSFVHREVEHDEDFNPEAPRGKGTVESCTLCVHRVDAGREPACVEACRAEGGGAMVFGDLNDPDSEIARLVARHATSRIRADLGLDPGVRYRGI